MTRIDSGVAPELVASRTTEVMPRDAWPFWFDGWPGETEAALLDAVFSSRAMYGSETTGVRKVVGAWRAQRGAALDRVGAFTELSTAELFDVLGNRQRVTNNGSTKVEAVQAAAAALVAAGVESSLDVDGSEAQRNAFTSVTGIGALSWEGFLAVLGVSTFDSDAKVADFVRASLDSDDLEGIDVDAVLNGAAILLETTPRTLRHSIWRYQRKLDSRPRVAKKSAEASAA